MVARRRLSDLALVGQEHALFPDTTMGDVRSYRSKREREKTARSSRVSLRSRADAFNATDRMHGRDFLDIIRDQGRKKDNQLYGSTTRRNQMGSPANHLVGALTVALSK